MYLFRATPILRETSNSLISGGQTFDTYIVSSVTSRGSFWGYQQPLFPGVAAPMPRPITENA